MTPEQKAARLRQLARADRAAPSLGPRPTPDLTEQARAEWANVLERLGGTFAVSLVYNSLGISPSKIHTDLKNLWNRLDRDLLGCRFEKNPRRSSVWAVIELLDQHPHVHCGWTFHVPDADLDRTALLVSAHWQAIAPAGSVDVQSYEQGWGNYATKSLSSSDGVIMLSNFDP